MRGLEALTESEALHVGELDFVAGSESLSATEEGGGGQQGWIEKVEVVHFDVAGVEVGERRISLREYMHPRP